MMSLLELNYLNYEERFEMPEWAKAEKEFNCDDFFNLFRKVKHYFH